MGFTPTPDSLLRVFMAYVPLEDAIGIEPQYTSDEIEEMLVNHSLLRGVFKKVKHMYGEDLYENCYGRAF